MQFTRAAIMGAIFIFENGVYAVTCGPVKVWEILDFD